MKVNFRFRAAVVFVLAIAIAVAALWYLVANKETKKIPMKGVYVVNEAFKSSL